ncbi:MULTISPECIES: hypothetical protein [unclassified Bradyrhizobium]|uniref:AbiTii domain-containing protein n=1 Tax=unclassified Bradyrhizobium TaxID=2631580 RepID=UPI0028EB203C|nr:MULTISPECIES: hypothetical protein [unclassified Bradyrhizobium]
MASKSQSEHILELSRELLDDIELGRLDTTKLLLKCSRLARLAGSEEIQKWISFEISGYSSSDPVSIFYMSKTGRWTDYEKKLGYWGPLAQQEATVAAYNAKLASMRLPDISGDWANVATSNILSALNATTNSISTLSAITSRVLGLLHDFVSEIYYQREFAALAETIFEHYKKNVDTLIAMHAGAVLTKIPAIIDRLSEGGRGGNKPGPSNLPQNFRGIRRRNLSTDRHNGRTKRQYPEARRSETPKPHRRVYSREDC